MIGVTAALGLTLVLVAGSPTVPLPGAGPTQPPTVISPAPGLTQPATCAFCGLPVPKSRTGPIVAAGTAIALDGLGILIVSSVTLLRRRRP